MELPKCLLNRAPDKLRLREREREKCQKKPTAYFDGGHVMECRERGERRDPIWPATATPQPFFTQCTGQKTHTSLREEGQRAMIAIPIVKYEDLSGVWAQTDRQADG